MKVILNVVAAAGLLTLAACGGGDTPAESKAENIEAAGENQADMIESNASNVADAVREHADNEAEAVMNAGMNAGANSH